MNKGGHISAEVLRYLQEHEKNTWTSYHTVNRTHIIGQQDAVDPYVLEKKARWESARDALDKALSIMLDDKTPTAPVAASGVDAFPRTELLQMIERELRLLQGNPYVSDAELEQRSRVLMDLMISAMHNRWTKSGYALVPTTMVRYP